METLLVAESIAAKVLRFWLKFISKKALNCAVASKPVP